MAKKEEKESKYAYKKKSAWDIFTEKQKKLVFDFSEEYKKFLDKSKTEREVIQYIKEKAKQYKKKIMINRYSSAAVIVPGKIPLKEGARIIISHVDSPRLDLKQIPLFEDPESNLALFETHYYGGIKKFHWVIIPLALHGVVITKNGKKLTFTLGEDESDPGPDR